MTYRQPRYTTLTTELGTFLLWSNGQRRDDATGLTVDTFGIRTDGAHNVAAIARQLVDPSKADDIAEAVTVNRVAWRFHSFGTLDNVGDVLTFGDGGGDTDRADWKAAPYESRAKADAKIRAAIMGPLEDWAKSDAGREFLRDARHLAAHNDAARLDRQIEETAAELAELREQRAAAERIMMANTRND